MTAQQTKICPQTGQSKFASCAICASYSISNKILDKLREKEMERLVQEQLSQATTAPPMTTSQLYHQATVNVRANAVTPYKDCADRAAEQSRLLYNSENTVKFSD